MTSLERLRCSESVTTAHAQGEFHVVGDDRATDLLHRHDIHLWSRHNWGLYDHHPRRGSDLLVYRMAQKKSGRCSPLVKKMQYDLY